MTLRGMHKPGMTLFGGFDSHEAVDGRPGTSEYQGVVLHLPRAWWP